MDIPPAPPNCCLDCRYCELKAGNYGTTRYRCDLSGRWIDSSTVLFDACERFKHWRDR